MDDVIQDYQFANAMINKIKIKIETGKYVELSMDFIGKI
jgi:hypothetical protein